MKELTHTEIWKGATLSIDNAQELYATAEILGIDGVYGLATSLMVLSAEESAKAFGLLSRGVYEQKWGDELKKYFRNHKYKHDNAGIFLVILLFMEEMIDELKSIENDPSISPQESKSIFFDRMQAGIVEKLEKSDESFISIINWQSTADDVKKKGLYVDFNNGKWSSPNDVGAVTYTQHRDIALRLLRRMQHLMETNTLSDLEMSLKEFSS